MDLGCGSGILSIAALRLGAVSAKAVDIDDKCLTVAYENATNKKTGKTKVISGSSPLRESVVVCKPDTTVDQLRRYCDRCHERWGITALQVFIHQDEGHYGIPEDKSTWKPNCHAHIVWDWMNHETGKSYKLGREDTSLMQDMVAECLGMERGTRKEETGKAHLERTDFIIAKQKREVEEAVNKKKHLDHENQVREKIGKELDDEIVRKSMTERP